MKRALLLLALLACSKKSAPPAHSDELSLPVRPPAVGLVIHEDSTQTSSMTLVRDAETTKLSEDEREVSRSQVLAVTDGAITKVEIHYETKQITHTVGDQREVETSPLEGHTYQVWVEGTEIKAAREDGSAVGDAEAAALAEDHGDLGKIPPITRVITGRAWKRDEPVTLDAPDLADLSKDPAVRATGGVFTWLAVDSGSAWFGNQATFVKDDDKGRIETAMAGKMEIDVAEVRPTRIDTHGTSNGVLRGALAGTTLEGTTEAHATYRYE